MDATDETVNGDGRATLRWLGAAHYQIEQSGSRMLIDPLYSRLPGGKPQGTARPEDLGGVDCLLVTHGHLDHAWDVSTLI